MPRVPQCAREAGVPGVVDLTSGEDDGDPEVLLNPIRTRRQLGPDDPRASVFDAEGRVRWEAVRGLAGISLRWVELRRLGQALVESPAEVLATASDTATSDTATSDDATSAGQAQAALRASNDTVDPVSSWGRPSR